MNTAIIILAAAMAIAAYLVAPVADFRDIINLLIPVGIS
jgi:hypothetical protein